MSVSSGPIGSVATPAVPHRLQTCPTSSGNSARSTMRSICVLARTDSSRLVPGSPQDTDDEPPPLTIAGRTPSQAPAPGAHPTATTAAGAEKDRRPGSRRASRRDRPVEPPAARTGNGSQGSTRPRATGRSRGPASRLVDRTSDLGEERRSPSPAIGRKSFPLHPLQRQDGQVHGHDTQLAEESRAAGAPRPPRRAGVSVPVGLRASDVAEPPHDVLRP